jgi:hypothetical protein
MLIIKIITKKKLNVKWENNYNCTSEDSKKKKTTNYYKNNKQNAS